MSLGTIDQDLSNILEFVQDGAEEFGDWIRCAVLDFDCDLFDFENIFSKPSHFVGMENKGFGVMGSQFGIKPFGVVGQIQLIQVRVGVAINRSSRSLQGVFNGIDIHECERKAVGKRRGKVDHGDENFKRAEEWYWLP